MEEEPKTVVITVVEGEAEVEVELSVARRLAFKVCNKDIEESQPEYLVEMPQASTRRSKFAAAFA